MQACPPSPLPNSTSLLSDPPLIISTFNLHSESIWHPNQDAAFGNAYVLDGDIAKDIERLQLGAASKDGADDEIIDRLAETDVHLLQFGILLAWGEDPFKRLARDMPTGVDVEVPE